MNVGVFLLIEPFASVEVQLKRAKEMAEEAGSRVATKSGMMLGLGETREEIERAMDDLREAGVTVLTLGQYLQPSKHHLPVSRYVHPDEFEQLRVLGESLGFSQVASGPMVRSSYHADLQAETVLNT